MEVKFHDPVRADTTIPFEERREAYARLVRLAEAPISA